jgi:hypothetical protein
VRHAGRGGSAGTEGVGTAGVGPIAPAAREGRSKLPPVVGCSPSDAGREDPYDPFGLTTVWPHADYPLIEVDVMELNRNPDNYFTEIEQAAFSPSNLVPGIDLSPDKMLQGRIFAYADAHRHQLGTHYQALPVNAAKCPVRPYHKDGPMRFFRNDTGNPDASYEPNSMEGPTRAPECEEPLLRLSGDAAGYDHRENNGDYVQARALFRLFDAAQRERLFSDVASGRGECRGRSWTAADALQKGFGGPARIRPPVSWVGALRATPAERDPGLAADRRRAALANRDRRRDGLGARQEERRSGRHRTPGVLKVSKFQRIASASQKPGQRIPGEKILGWGGMTCGRGASMSDRDSARIGSSEGTAASKRPAGSSGRRGRSREPVCRGHEVRPCREVHSAARPSQPGEVACPSKSAPS